MKCHQTKFANRPVARGDQERDSTLASRGLLYGHKGMSAFHDCTHAARRGAPRGSKKGQKYAVQKGAGAERGRGSDCAGECETSFLSQEQVG